MTPLLANIGHHDHGCQTVAGKGDNKFDATLLLQVTDVYEIPHRGKFHQPTE